MPSDTVANKPYPRFQLRRKSIHNLGFIFLRLKLLTYFLFKFYFKIGANRGNECLPLKPADAPQKAQGKCVCYRDAPLFMTPQTLWKRPCMLTSVMA
jgi:hypothetical protein